MGVFRVFKILQMVPNRAAHHIQEKIDVWQCPKHASDAATMGVL